MSMAILSVLSKIPELLVYGNDYPTKDGTGVRDYIHPSDLAVAHVLAIKYLESDNKSEIFNLATGYGSSVLEVIKAVESASGKKVKYKITDRRSGDASISIADSSKAEKILGWKTKYNLTDMAKTAWKWESCNKEKILKK
jgi:UDP-glucose 4-epimerase